MNTINSLNKEIESLIETKQALVYFNNKHIQEIETLHQFIRFNELKSFEVSKNSST